MQEESGEAVNSPVKSDSEEVPDNNPVGDPATASETAAPDAENNGGESNEPETSAQLQSLELDVADSDINADSSKNQENIEQLQQPDVINPDLDSANKEVDGTQAEIQEKKDVGAAEDAAPAPVSRRRWTPRKTVTLPLASMETGQKVSGSVRKIMSYGAFVDVGAEKDGLLHVSRMASGFVRDVSEVCKVGDTLEVIIIQIDEAKGNFSLATVANVESKKDRERERGPPKASSAEKWANFKFNKEEFVEGVVKHVADFGAFVDISGPADGLVHVSEIPRDKPKDSLSPGMKIKVRILTADEKRSRIGLSMKEYELDSAAVSEQVRAAQADQPVFKTSFEIAFEKANALKAQEADAR